MQSLRLSLKQRAEGDCLSVEPMASRSPALFATLSSAAFIKVLSPGSVDVPSQRWQPKQYPGLDFAVSIGDRRLQCGQQSSKFRRCTGHTETQPIAHNNGSYTATPVLRQ